jgi:hypothetical protein
MTIILTTRITTTTAGIMTTTATKTIMDTNPLH